MQYYHIVELRKNMIDEIGKNYSGVKIYKSNIEKKMNFKNNFFDRIHTVHVLEHLKNLPNAIAQTNRSLANHGIFQVVLPCDPGFLSSIARKISAEKFFKKKYNMDYNWFIDREHINSPEEIFFCLKNFFKIINIKYFPFNFIPFKDVNLAIGLTLKKKS